MFGIGIYVKHSKEAVPFYMDVFGLELGYHVKNRDGSYFHSELTKDGKEVLSVVESPDDAVSNNVVCLGITLEDETAVRSAYEKLLVGGRVQMEICELPWSPCAAGVVDRFGCWWYLTCPQHRPDDDFDPENYQEDLHETHS